MKIEWNKKYTTIAAYVLIVAIVGTVIYFFLDNIGYFKNGLSTFVSIMMPFIYGVSFAYIFHPIMAWFEKRVLPFLTGRKLTRRCYRTISILLTIVLGVSVIVILFSFIIPELIKNVNGLILQIAAYAPNIEKLLIDLLSRFHIEEVFAPVITTITSTVEQFFSQTFDLISKSLSGIINATINITSMVINVFVGIIITVYLWSAKENFFAQIKKLGYAFLPETFVNRAIGLLHESNAIFGGFITGKIIDSAIIGVLCYIGMLILDIPFALLISVIVGVTNVIPYFGPFIGAIPSIVLLLMVNPLKALWFGIFILILQQIDGNIIGPKILGDSTGLSAFWVIFAVTVFGGLFGFVGMLIGVPLFAVIYTIIRRTVNNHLKNRGMSTVTDDYASSENPIIKKGERISTHYRKEDIDE